jgi:hypothetical protein
MVPTLSALILNIQHDLLYVITSMHCVFYSHIVTCHVSGSSCYVAYYLCAQMITLAFRCRNWEFSKGGRKKVVVVLQHFIVLVIWQKMVLLVYVYADQKGMGSVLAISSYVLARNNDAPAAAMPAGETPTIFPPPSRTDNLAWHCPKCKKHHLLLLYDWILALQLLSSDWFE